MGKIKGLSQRIKSINLPCRSSVAFTASSVISKAAALFLTPVFTRLLSPSEYGAYSLFNSYLSVMLVLGTLELGGSAVLRAFQRYRGREYTVILTAMLIILPFSLAVTVGLLALRALGGADVIFPGAYPMLFISIISSGVINLFCARAKFLYKPRLSIILSVLQGIVAPLTAIVLIQGDILPSISRVTLKLGCATLVSLFITVALLLRMRHSVMKELDDLEDGEKAALLLECSRLLLRLSLPMLPYYFSIMAIAQADKLAISRFLGKAALGSYSVAYSAGLAPLCISHGLIAVLTPWVMRKARSREIARIRLTMSTVFFIICALTAVFLSLAPEIFTLLAPVEYRAALPVFFIIAVAPMPLFLMSLESAIAFAYERTLPTVLTGTAVSALSVLATYTLTPRLGYVAAATAVVLAYCLIAVVQAFNVQRLLGKFPIAPMQCTRALLLTATLSLGMLALAESLLARLLLAAFPIASLIYMLIRARGLLREEKTKSQ